MTCPMCHTKHASLLSATPCLKDANKLRHALPDKAERDLIIEGFKHYINVEFKALGR